MPNIQCVYSHSRKTSRKWALVGLGSTSASGRQSPDDDTCIEMSNGSSSSSRMNSSMEKRAGRRHTIASGGASAEVRPRYATVEGKKGKNRSRHAASDDDNASMDSGSELDVAQAAALDCLTYRTSFSKIQGLAFKALSKLEGMAEAAHVIENNSINAISKYLAETRETATTSANNRRGGRGNRGSNDNQGGHHTNAIESAIKSNLLASSAHQKMENLIQDLARMMERIMHECSENKENLQEASESFKEMSKLSAKPSEPKSESQPPQNHPKPYSIPTSSAEYYSGNASALQSELNILKDVHRIEMEASESQHRDEIAVLKMAHEREVDLLKTQVQSAKDSAQSYMSECHSLREQLVFSLQHDGPVVISETKSQTLTLQTKAAKASKTDAGAMATTPTTPQGSQMSSSSSSSSSLSSIREFRSFLAEIDSDNYDYNSANNVSVSTPSSDEEDDDDEGKQLMMMRRRPKTKRTAAVDLSLTKELRRLDDLERFHMEYLDQVNTY